MTITLHGDDVAVEQAAKQLYRLIDVLKVQDVTDRADRRAGAGPGQGPGDRREPGRGPQARRAVTGRVVDLADGSVIVEVTGTEAEVDAFVALVRTLRHQGTGPDRRRRHGARLGHPSRRRSSDDGEDVLRQRRRPGGAGRPDRRDHRLRQPGPRPRPQPPRLGRRRRRRPRAGLQEPGPRRGRRASGSPTSPTPSRPPT